MDEIVNALSPNTILQGKSHKYVIRKALGQGSFGITYLAEIIPQDGKTIPGLSLKVAIKEFFMKTINGRSGDNVTVGSKSGFFSEYGAKFLREANNLAKISHRNIVDVLEVFEQNNTVYYSMEYIDGGNLDDYINRKGHLAEEEAIWMTKEIGSAISHMHSLHMLHLDVKPLNIMRSKDGKLKLIDFGLSKQYNENGEPESSTSVGGGTPGYSPIEQANYKDGHGFPVTMDVYALGATLYKMLTGERAPLASDILNEGFPINDLMRKGVSSLTKEALLSAMQPIKKDRPQNVSDFLNMLPEISNNMQGCKEKYNEDEQTIYEEQTELEIVDVECNQLNKGILIISNDLSLLKFVYTNNECKRSEVKSYQLEVTGKRIKASYVMGNGKEFHKSYFIAPNVFDSFIDGINSLQLVVKQNVNSNSFTNKHIELTIWEGNNIIYNCSNFDKKKQIIDGNVEGLCKIMEKQIRIDKLIIHKDSPVLQKAMYYLFKNKLY